VGAQNWIASAGIPGIALVALTPAGAFFVREPARSLERAS